MREVGQTGEEKGKGTPNHHATRNEQLFWEHRSTFRSLCGNTEIYMHFDTVRTCLEIDELSCRIQLTGTG